MTNESPPAQSAVRSIKPKIYVAGPYRVPDPCVNTNATVRIADKIVDMGGVPFVPHLTLLWNTVSPRDEDFWLKWDLEWLEACDALYRISGYSTGADAEVVRAKELDIPVFENLPILGDWIARTIVREESLGKRNGKVAS